MMKPKFCVLITTIISFVLFIIFLCILIFSSDKSKKNEKSSKIEQVQNLNFENIDFIKIHRKFLKENILTKQNFFIYMIYMCFFWKKNKEILLTPQNTLFLRIIQEIFIKIVLDEKIDYNNYQKNFFDAIPNSKGKTYKEILYSFDEIFNFCLNEFIERRINEIPKDMYESYTKILAKIQDLCVKELINEKYV
ncbi:hypothetical protein GVAV_001705 [Gurleya vavrai]